MIRVEWSVLEGGQTESVLATCIYIDHPRSNRIRPSQGDYGIDVLEPVGVGDEQVDVWQIKRFATKFQSSEKTQVEKSFRRVLLALVRRNIPLRNWYLVMPLDPTIESRMDWFATMPECVFAAMKVEADLALTDGEVETIQAWLDDPATRIEWKGLDFCEAAVAAHPEVPDYFLHGGSQRLRDSIATLSGLLTRDQALRTDPDSPSMLQPGEITEHLRLVQTALDGDPHFRYGFQLEPQPSTVHLEPNLVAATQEVLPDGRTLTYRIYTRFDEALNERPIPVKLNFSFDSPSFNREAFEDWRDYGAEFVGPATVSADLPGGVTAPTEGQVRFPALPSTTFQRRYRLTDPEGKKLAELMFTCKTTKGLSARSARVTGVDTSNLVSVDWRGSLDKDEGKISFNAEPLDGAEVLRAAPVARFLGSWQLGNILQLSEAFGGKFANIHSLPSNEELIHPLLVTWIEALAEIQEHVTETILLPPLDQVTRKDVRDVSDAAALLRGQTVVVRWEEITLTDLTVPLSDGAHRVETDEPLILKVGAQTLTLGMQVFTFLSAQVAADGNSARLVPLHNDTAHRTLPSPVTSEPSATD